MSMGLSEALHETMMLFQPQPEQHLHMEQKAGGPPELGTGNPIPNGIVQLDNGNLEFTMYAPGAYSVEVKIGKTHILKLKQDAEVFRLETQPFSFKGPVLVEFRINGIAVLHPYAPICYSNQRLQNYYEASDPEITELICKADIPHGTIHKELYESKVLQRWVRCFVYTPPCYDYTKQYPVLYLQHGAGENETAWVIQGKVAYLMDALLAKNEIKPFIVVMNDGMLKLEEEKTIIDSFNGLSMVITEDCRNMIEAKYAVSSKKADRAIAGLSLGSMFATYCGCTYPKLFGSIGIFSGFIRRRDHYPAYEDNPYLETLQKELKQHQFQLLFRSMGDQDLHFHEFLEDDSYLQDFHVNELASYHRVVYRGYSHEWACWRRTFCDFARLLFRSDI